MKLKNLKLGTKQLIGFGCIVAIMAGVNLYSQQTIQALKNELDEVTSNWLQRMSAVSEISRYTTSLRLYQLQHAFATQEDTKQQQADDMVGLIDKINASLDVYEQLKAYSEQRDLYSEEEGRHYHGFIESWERYQDLFFEIFRHSRSGNSQEAVALLNGQAQTVFEVCSAELSELVQINERGSFEAARRAEQRQSATHKISATLLLVTIALSITFSILLVRYITVPVRRLVHAAGHVAQGNLTVRLEMDSEDEIGELTTSFNRMTEALQKARAQTDTQQRELESANRDLAQINTDLQRTMYQLQETQQQLVMQEKMAALGDLVAGVAHEINSPSGVVTGATDVSNRCIARIERALSELNHDDPALKTALKLLQDNLRVTTEAGNRIATIVKSLKTFARLDEAEYQTVDLHEGIDSSLTLIENELRGRIAVEKHYAEDGRLTCYASQLNQVFLTLLKNAAAAIEGNGTILIRTERHDGMMHIQIADTGRGMSEDLLKRIFDFGFSAGGTRVRMRSGLSSAYTIIQKHNGQIRVESEVGKGTTFFIDLPIV